MGVERYLISRNNTGEWDKSRPEDKLPATTSSFFAPIAQNPPTQSLDFLGGFVYIGNNFVQLSDSVIGLGTTGSNPTNAIPANFYNVAFLSLNSAGVVVKTEGTPGATPLAVVPPVTGFPLGTFPFAIVSYQDDGTGGAGTILPLTPANVQDVRPFFYSTYGQPTFATDVISDLKVQAKAPPAPSVTVQKGYVWFTNLFVQITATQNVDFSVPGAFYSPAMSANFYNIAVLCVSQFGFLDVKWGTPAATPGAVVPPVTPSDQIPLAFITVQDNGSGVTGTILPILPSAIQDVRPFLNSTSGSIQASSLSYCRVTADFPNDQSVFIDTGVVYPDGNLNIFPKTVINFNAAGLYQFPASTPGTFRKALLGINAAGNVYIAFSAAAVNPASVILPNIPDTIIPLAYVTMQDNGSGIPGSINPIAQSDIEDIRPFLGALGGGGGAVVVNVEKEGLYTQFLEDTYFRQGYYEDFTDTSFIDGVHTTATVDVLINNDCVIAPGQVFYSTSLFDNGYVAAPISNVDLTIVAVDSSTTTNLLIEGSNDGVHFFTFPLNTVYNFTSTVGTNLIVRFTNTGVSGNITLFSYGIFYNETPFPGDQPKSVPSRMAYVQEKGRLLRKTLTSIKDNAVVDTANINQLANDMYSLGSAALLGTVPGNAVLPFALQKYLAPVKAVVNPTAGVGTHTDLQSAINAVPAGSLILVDSAVLTLTAPVNVNKNDLTIMGCGRGTVFNGTGGSPTIIGLNITSPGVKIKGLKLNNFTTAVKVTSEDCMIVEDYFSSNTVDIDHSGVTNIVLEGNIDG